MKFKELLKEDAANIGLGDGQDEHPSTLPAPFFMNGSMFSATYKGHRIDCHYDNVNGLRCHLLDAHTGEMITPMNSAGSWDSVDQVAKYWSGANMPFSDDVISTFKAYHNL